MFNLEGMVQMNCFKWTGLLEIASDSGEYLYFNRSPESNFEATYKQSDGGVKKTNKPKTKHFTPNIKIYSSIIPIIMCNHLATKCTFSCAASVFVTFEFGV